MQEYCKNIWGWKRVPS